MPSNSVHQTQFICKLIEADVELLLSPEFAISIPADLQRYRHVLLAFHRGDATALEKLIKASGDTALSFDPINILLKMRLGIVTRKLTSSELKCVLESKQDLGPWWGEALIVAAAGYEVIEDFQSALRCHQEAAIELRKIGAAGKALRAESNAIANLSNLEPERKLIPEFFSLYRQAKKLRQYHIMATILLNLSREYQRMGALKNALKLCNRALAASKSNPGGQIYYLVIAHRAHLLFDLGHRLDAETDLELARTSDFPVVKSACQVLSVIFGEHPATVVGETKGLSTWTERLREHHDPAHQRSLLSPVEESLVQFLAEKPRGKFEITDHLFGKDLHPLTAENRLKNLIHRVRKKVPGLILLKGEAYTLADVETQVRTRSKIKSK
jgi:tetratricopeptide (TPR) repeat protein